ncbi:MAG: ribbon-helix-helix protein, CopG family [Burkholderiales bacterium]|nr:ribbon-helix-helix protein, CopG family [Burkholderiales bacterium]
MAVSVRLDPVLEARLTQQAALLGVTKSDFIKDALERVLGMKDPAALLRQVRRAGPMGRPNASAQVSATMKARLRAKRPD